MPSSQKKKETIVLTKKIYEQICLRVGIVSPFLGIYIILLRYRNMAFL